MDNRPAARNEYINCESDDRDLSLVIAAVDDKINAIKEQNPDAKIRIWCAELHDMPSNKLIQPAIVELVTKIGAKVAAGFECAENFFEVYMRESFLHRVREGGFDALSKADIGGENRLRMLALFHGQVMAPMTIEAVCEYFLETNVHTFFTDSIRPNHGNYIQMACNNGSELSEGFNKSAQCSHFFSRNGMAMRNRSMVANTALLCADYDIVVQQIGAAHLYGDAARGFEYGQSCMGLAKQDDNIVDIAVMPNMSNAHMPTIPAHAVVENTIFVDGLTADAADEPDLLRSIKGVPEFFAAYSAMDRERRYQFSSEIRQFLRGLENATPGIVKNMRPATF